MPPRPRVRTHNRSLAPAAAGIKDNIANTSSGKSRDTAAVGQDEGADTLELELTSPLSPISPWPPLSPSARMRRASVLRNDVPPPRVGPGVDSLERQRDHSAVVSAESELGETLPSAAEVYGFIAVLATYAAFAVYLIWALAPPGTLDTWGWTWYPDREWAVVVPCYLMLIVLLTYWSYAGLTAWHTAPFDSLALVTDKYANIPERIPGQAPYYHRFAASRAVPEAVDLPLDLVNMVLYPPRRRR